MKLRVVVLMAVTAVVATIDDSLNRLPSFMRVPTSAVVSAQATEPGFTIGAYNDTVSLGLSDEDSYNLLLDPVGGFTGAVVCDVSALPSGVSGTFTPPEGPPHPGPF